MRLATPPPAPARTFKANVPLPLRERTDRCKMHGIVDCKWHPCKELRAAAERVR